MISWFILKICVKYRQQGDSIYIKDVEASLLPLKSRDFSRPFDQSFPTPDLPRVFAPWDTVWEPVLCSLNVFCRINRIGPLRWWFELLNKLIYQYLSQP